VLVARVDPAQARAEAKHILSDRRYRNAPAPRPLRKPLEWLGDRLRDIGHAISAALRAVPGPTWLAVAIVCIAAAIGFVVFLARARRTGGGAHSPATTTGGPQPEDPAAFEREADAAEAAGDLERAVRLRFRAGLLRLGQRGVIRYRPSLTTNEVRRLLGSDTFDDLATRFEEVAYGGRDAEVADVRAARESWPRVLDDARRR
jgi:Domain of unknown function (DUF4129)